MKPSIDAEVLYCGRLSTSFPLETHCGSFGLIRVKHRTQIVVDRTEWLRSMLELQHWFMRAFFYSKAKEVCLIKERSTCNWTSFCIVLS